MKILVVCGAGASSTFVARRLAQAATRAGRDWHAQAGTEQTALNATDTDLVLIGPHLADRAESIRAALTGRSRVIVLPDDAFTDIDGSRTLQLVDDAVHTPHNRKETP